jgi:hypothetical protein
MGYGFSRLGGHSVSSEGLTGAGEAAAYPSFSFVALFFPTVAWVPAQALRDLGCERQEKEKRKGQMHLGGVNDSSGHPRLILSQNCIPVSGGRHHYLATK